MIRRRLPGGGADAGVELAPLVDVVFLLFIFFFVVTTFIDRQKTLEIDLPEAKSATAAPDDPLRVEVGVDAIAVGGKRVTLEELRELLAAAARSGRTVVVAGDRLAPYERFVLILDTSREVGLRNLSLAADEAS